MDSYAWLGSMQLKEEILADLAEDQARDRYVQGSYIAGANDEEQAFFGCHVGCLMMAQARYENRHGDHAPEPLYALARAREEVAPAWHGQVPEKLGMPRDLAEFWDKFFEALPSDLAPRWAVESLECVPVGADLRNVLHQLIAWLLVDEKAGFLARAPEPTTSDEQQLGSYLVVLGSYWQHRAQDYTRSSHVGLDPIQTDEMAQRIQDLGRGIGHDERSPYYWASLALHSAASGTVTHHVAGALINEWVEAFHSGAVVFPDDYDPFTGEDADQNPRWFIANKFFDLCAHAPQGKPALV